MRADVEGWKSIAAYIADKTGLSFGWEAARKHSRKARHALRVERAGRRIYARFSDLDTFAAWYVAQISDGVPVNPTQSHTAAI